MQEVEPGPPKSRDERAAGTQKRLGVQARPGAGDLTHHRVGWTVPLKKESKKKDISKPTTWGSHEIGAQVGAGIDSCSVGDKVQSK